MKYSSFGIRHFPSTRRIQSLHLWKQLYKGIRTLQFQVSREERKIELQEVRETQTLLKEDHHTTRRLAIGPTFLADYLARSSHIQGPYLRESYMNFPWWTFDADDFCNHCLVLGHSVIFFLWDPYFFCRGPGFNRAFMKLGLPWLLQNDWNPSQFPLLKGSFSRGEFLSQLAVHHG